MPTSPAGVADLARPGMCLTRGALSLAAGPLIWLVRRCILPGPAGGGLGTLLLWGLSETPPCRLLGGSADPEDPWWGRVTLPLGMVGALEGFQDPTLAPQAARGGALGKLGAHRALFGAGAAAEAGSWSAAGLDPQLVKDVILRRAPLGPDLFLRRRQQQTAPHKHDVTHWLPSQGHAALVLCMVSL